MHIEDRINHLARCASCVGVGREMGGSCLLLTGSSDTTVVLWTVAPLAGASKSGCARADAAARAARPRAGGDTFHPRCSVLGNRKRAGTATACRRFVF